VGVVVVVVVVDEEDVVGVVVVVVFVELNAKYPTPTAAITIMIATIMP
jgi:hypothetical protein